MPPSEYFDKILVEKRETIERLTREVEALRKLPVIRTCEDCAWGTVCSVPGTRRCYHPTQLSEAPQVTGAPPEWCPLRGGVSDAPR